MNFEQGNTNTRVVLKEYLPQGTISASYFSVDKSQVVPSPDTLANDQVLVSIGALSMDPHLRLFITESDSDKSTDSYNPHDLHPLGEAMSSIGVGTVVASNSKKFSVGDRVRATDMPWQEFAVLPDHLLEKLPGDDSIALEDYIGVLGMPAFTAYLGVVTLGQAKAGETLLVSAASGAVGQMVVQLAKARGLTVVGVAGSDQKTAYVSKIGADAVINYKTCGDFEQAIKAAAPQGIDVYFDSVGGEFLDATLLNLNSRARVILCGSMTTFGADRSTVKGVKNLDTMIVKEVVMRGLFYQPHVGTQAEADFVVEASRLVKQGAVHFKTDVREGLEQAPQALADLYSGGNFGKLIVRV
ncbi:hypothetical protein H4R99_007223 [Coemansia sp. RSA 1722]|nr:hypothetical protein LPJ57_007436 [Coemansia sp. RSA 486]KAJ2231302.1 hypothetical protein IWW45_005515 [Coemansia sp. RSA 485]KAJ2590084.1 hypothetical protein H4R99_007223 [Coemansia sp. RSA 1722]